MMLTTKGKAHVLLTKVRDQWEQFTPDQRAEVADLVAQLAAALRREQMSVRTDNPRPLPLVGRLSA
jgi:hypothetical protein